MLIYNEKLSKSYQTGRKSCKKYLKIAFKNLQNLRSHKKASKDLEKALKYFKISKKLTKI